MGARSEVHVCNLALSRIGIGRQLTDTGAEHPANAIAGVTDDTPEAQACKLWYEVSRDAVLAELPWPFARGFVTVPSYTVASPPAPWADEWPAAYTYPTESIISIRRIVTGSFEEDPNPPRFVRRFYNDETVLLSDYFAESLVLEFTRKLTDLSLWPALAVSMLAWRVAADVAIPLNASEQMRSLAMAMYLRELEQAAASAFSEEMPREPVGSAWVRAAMGTYGVPVAHTRGISGAGYP